MNNCPKCDSPLLPNAKACSKCGEVISSSADNFTFDYNSLYAENNDPANESDTPEVETSQEEPLVVENQEIALKEVNEEAVETETSIEEQKEIETPVSEITEEVTEEVTETETPIEEQKEIETPVSEIVEEVTEEVIETEKPIEEQKEIETTVSEIVEEVTEEVTETETPIEEQKEIETPVSEIIEEVTEEVTETETPIEEQKEIETPVSEIIEEVSEKSSEVVNGELVQEKSIPIIENIDIPVISDIQVVPEIDSQLTNIPLMSQDIPMSDGIMISDIQPEMPYTTEPFMGQMNAQIPVDIPVQPAIEMPGMGTPMDPMFNTVPTDMPMQPGMPYTPTEPFIGQMNAQIPVDIPVQSAIEMPDMGTPMEPMFNAVPTDMPMQPGMPYTTEPFIGQMNAQIPVDIPVQPAIDVPSMGMSSLEQINPMAMPIIENQQPIPYVPPVIPQPVNQENGSKFNKIIFIVVISVSVIAIFLMIFFMVKMFSNKNTNDNANEIGNATQYNYEGFEFYLPKNIIADVTNGEFVIASTDSKWNAIMTIQDGSYNTLVSNKTQLKSYYEQLGYTADEAEEKEISGTGFVTIQVTMGSEKVLVAYAKANGIKMFGIILNNEENEYNNDSLIDIGKILSTMNYAGPKYNLPEGFTIDMFNDTFKVAE